MMMAAGEHTLDYVGLERTSLAEEDEREVAQEIVAALADFADGWFRPLALELRLAGCHRETLAETDGPAEPYQSLRVEPRPDDVEIRPIYRVIETTAPTLSAPVIAAWLDRCLAQSCPDPASETSLGSLYVHASQVAIPGGWPGDVVPLDSTVGQIAVPVAHRGGGAWIDAPPGHLLKQPIAVSISNALGWARFNIQIHWTPWVGELARPESPLAQAVARLVARGWQLATD
ncbi:MAG: hypothetical protein ABL886_13570 [Rhodoglobus sp.]